MHEFFDGHIVAVVDRDMSDETASTLLNDQVFFGEGSSLPETSSGTVSRLMDRAEPLPFLTSWEKDFRRLIGGFAADTRVTEIFLSGRMRMSLLLDSSGGDTRVFECYRKLADYIKKRSGQVDAYVRDEAQSNGANLFALAHHRATLPTSLFLWHTPIFRGNIVNDLGYLRQFQIRMADEARKAFTGFLLGSCRSEHRFSLNERIENAARESSNDTMAVYFRGAELHELGIAHELDSDIDTMQKSFSERAGISCDLLPQNHPIRRFFFILEA